MAMGHIVCEGIEVPILAIRLRVGGVCIVAGRRGPVPAVSGPVTIFGEDGQGVGQGGQLSWDEAGDGELLTVRITARFDVLRGEGEEQ